MGQTSKIQRIEQALREGREAESSGEQSTALAAFRRAARLCDDATLHRHKAEALRLLGHIFARRSEWDAAREAYEKSLQLSIERSDLIGEADARNSLGIMFFELGELDKSVECYDQALSIAQNTRDFDLAATICNNQGALANVRGEWQKALTLYEESLPRFELSGNTAALTNTYLNIAMTHADNGNWSGAQRYYTKCNELAREIGNPHLLATIKVNRVELYIAIGDLKLAEALCRQALDGFSAVDDHLGEADTYTMLGVIHGKRKEWRKASTCFLTGIRLAREHGSPLSEAEAHMQYGRMLHRKKSNAAARKHLSEALVLFTALNARKETDQIRLELRKIPARG